MTPDCHQGFPSAPASSGVIAAALFQPVTLSYMIVYDRSCPFVGSIQPKAAGNFPYQAEISGAASGDVLAHQGRPVLAGSLYAVSERKQKTPRETADCPWADVGHGSWHELRRSPRQSREGSDCDAIKRLHKRSPFGTLKTRLPLGGPSRSARVNDGLGNCIHVGVDFGIESVPIRIPLDCPDPDVGGLPAKRRGEIGGRDVDRVRGRRETRPSAVSGQIGIYR